MLVDMKKMMPDYQPEVLSQRPRLSSIQNSSGGFDDKMIIVDASDRGDKRGFALPLLLDLDRKEKFLHDVSVTGLDALLDPRRGDKAPHPFYISDPSQRGEMVDFLRGLDTRESPVARKEMIEDPTQKIGRPRQLYTGHARRPFVPVGSR